MTILQWIWMSLALVGAVTGLRMLAAVHSALLAGQQSCGVVWREMATAATRGTQYVVLLGIVWAVSHFDRAAIGLLYPVLAMVGTQELSQLATLVIPGLPAAALQPLTGIFTDQAQGKGG